MMRQGTRFLFEIKNPSPHHGGPCCASVCNYSVMYLLTVADRRGGSSRPLSRQCTPSASGKGSPTKGDVTGKPFPLAHPFLDGSKPGPGAPRPIWTIVSSS